MTSTRVLITASRDWWDAIPIRHAFAQTQADFPADKFTLAHGAADGGDLIGAGVALTLGWKLDPYPVTSSDWRVHGKTAGFIRNQAMVDRGAAVCLAFFMPCSKPNCRKPKPHDSHGATDCAERAERAGIPVRRHWGESR